MRDWFESLSGRERLVLTAGAAFLVFTAVFAGIVRPLARASELREARVSEKQAVLDELTQVAARIGIDVSMPDEAGSASAGQSIVVVIDRTTRSRGLGPYLKRNQPDGAASVRIRFEEAPFDDVIGWVAELAERHGMQVSSASFDRAGAAGRVNVSLVLNRSVG